MTTVRVCNAITDDALRPTIAPPLRGGSLSEHARIMGRAPRAVRPADDRIAS